MAQKQNKATEGTPFVFLRYHDASSLSLQQEVISAGERTQPVRLRIPGGNTIKMAIILGVSIQRIFRHDFSETGTVSVNQLYRTRQEVHLIRNPYCT
jgi:hypothetical protein